MRIGRSPGFRSHSLVIDYASTHHLHSTLPVGYNECTYMGMLEKGSRERTRRNQLRKIILHTIKAVGIISLALIVPNAVGAMAKMGLISSPRQQEVIRRSCERLVRQGLLKRENKKLRLTQKGEQTLRMLSLKEQLHRKPRRWDGKWRVLIFDIPEYRANLRHKIRDTLRTIGFVRLQNSVWVYPYDF